MRCRRTLDSGIRYKGVPFAASTKLTRFGQHFPKTLDHRRQGLLEEPPHVQPEARHGLALQPTRPHPLCPIGLPGADG